MVVNFTCKLFNFKDVFKSYVFKIICTCLHPQLLLFHAVSDSLMQLKPALFCTLLLVFAAALPS